jgi:membrane protein
MAWALIKRSALKWNEDDCLTLGAALAYYTVFSLAPILVIAIAVASAVFGEEAAKGEIVGQDSRGSSARMARRRSRR